MGILEDSYGPEVVDMMKQYGQVSPELQNKARNNALMNAGFAMLASNGLGATRNQSLGRALGAGGLAGMHSYNSYLDDAQQQQAQQMQMAGQMEKLIQQRKKAEMIAQFRNNLPEQDRQLFDVAPEDYIKNMPQFQKQQLVEIADPNEPLRTQKVWMRPGETQGTVAGLGSMPELLDPRIQNIRKGIAAAGKSDVSVSYGAPVSGVDKSGNPIFFQPSKTGGEPAIIQGVKPPGEAEKPLTEPQAKASAYLGQMKAAEDLLSSILKDQSKIGEQADIRMAGSILNPLASPKAQQIGQAQNQWSEAFLRFKTGAAATPDEVKLNNATFFPQFGDKPEVVKQKERMRQQAANDMSVAAGKGSEKVGSVYAGEKKVVRTGKYGGKKVVEYSDGTINYAD